MSAKIKIAIAVVLVAVLIVLAIGLLSCGDDDVDDVRTPATRDSGGGDDKAGSGSQPSLRTIETKRSSGPHATVAPGALLTAPDEIWLRVSAAPKQKVKGNWNVTCGRLGTSTDTFEVTPPSIMRPVTPTESAGTTEAT